MKGGRYEPKPTVGGKTLEETLKGVFEDLTPKKTSDIIEGEAKVIKKDSLSIRLMKSFEKELDDIGLKNEGYSDQEIDVLKKARNIMKTEGQNPTEALRWVRGEMADDAGAEIDEFMPDFPWDDAFAQGGRVGFKTGGIANRNMIATLFNKS